MRRTTSALASFAWPWALLFACGDDGAKSGGAGSGASGPGTAQGPTGTAEGPTGTGATTGAGGMEPTPVDCDPLPPPSGQTIMVDPSQASELVNIVGSAPAGATIVLAPGTYTVPGILQLRSDGVTVRSANDDPSSVVLDANYAVNEIFQVTANDVTIAHVTITRAVDHLVHAFPPGPGVTITGLRLYGVAMVDGGEQFLKVNPIGSEIGYVDEGRVECSTFTMTSAGRANVEPCCGGCYTGGIDVHAGWNWVVARNHFEGIYCDNGGLAEHAVHFWRGSRGTLVEGNTIVDCARGIGLGLGGGAGERVYPDNPQGGDLLAHYDGIVRNNFVSADIAFFDTGIEIQEAREPVVLHNTVIATAAATGFFSSIDYRFASTFAVIKNNLVEVVTQRDGAMGDVSSNHEMTPLDWFVDAAGGDLHITDAATGAIGQGEPHPQAGLDIDGEPHDPSIPDIGADER